MKSLVDVNVVFPILVAWHSHHAPAWHWWEHRNDSSVALSWLVRLGVLRLLTNPRTMEGRPVSTSAAWDAWESFAADPRTFWMDTLPSQHEAIFRRNVVQRAPTPNLWTDAWLAALAEASGLYLTTFDNGFRQFDLRRLETLS